MTKDEALQLALDVLEKISMGGDPRWADEAIAAINEALETEEGLLDRKSYLLGLYDQKSRVGIETKYEPVAWGMEKDGVILDVICPAEHEREEGEYTIPLYTTPQIETKDEPVAWMYWQSCLNDDGTQTSPWVQRYSKFKPTESVINKDITPLYITPQRTWVGLTDEEITEIRLKTFDAIATNQEIYRAIEAKLKEKNT